MGAPNRGIGPISPEAGIERKSCDFNGIEEKSGVFAMSENRWGGEAEAVISE